MSKFVKIQTELREAVYLTRALDDLRLPYRENAIWQHRYSRNQRVGAIVVDAPGAQVGFAPSGVSDGVLELLFDDMQKETVETLLGKIRQRYAYHKVLDEAKTAGFDLVEERTGADDIVRLTVRRWA